MLPVSLRFFSQTPEKLFTLAKHIICSIHRQTCRLILSHPPLLYLPSSFLDVLRWQDGRKTEMWNSEMDLYSERTWNSGNDESVFFALFLFRKETFSEWVFFLQWNEIAINNNKIQHGIISTIIRSNKVFFSRSYTKIALPNVVVLPLRNSSECEHFAMSQTVRRFRFWENFSRSPFAACWRNN